LQKALPMANIISLGDCYVAANVIRNKVVCKDISKPIIDIKYIYSCFSIFYPYICGKMKKLFNFTRTESIETMQTDSLYTLKRLRDGVDFMQIKDSNNISASIPQLMILINGNDGMVDVYNYNKEIKENKIEKEIVLKDFDTYLMPLL